MKTYLKKISALVLTVILVLSMCTAAVADEPSGGTSGTTQPEVTTSTGDGTSEDRGTITVKGVTVETDTEGNVKNPTVTAYPIIAAKYDNGGHFSGYKSLYTDFITDEYLQNTEHDVEVTEEQLTNIIKNLKIENTGDYKPWPMTANNGTYTAKVPVGSYLVLITGAEAKIYSPVVVSVEYVWGDGTGNPMEGGIVNIAGSNSWVKVRNNPDLKKEIVGSDMNNDHGNTVNIGDDVNYKLTTEIPYYSGLHPVFNISDKLEGLDYNDNSLVVKVLGNASGVEEVTLINETHYHFTETNDGFTVDFVLSGEYTLNQYQGRTLEITYSAKVADDALINEDAKTNEATLKYSHDSTQQGDVGEDKDKTYTYTFDIDAAVDGSVTDKILTKVGVDSSTSKHALEGAEFTLYTDKDCTKIYSNTWGTDPNDPVEPFDGVVTSDSEGQLRIKGLKAGTYYLKETKAPENYALINTVYAITITPELNTDGSLKSWTISINGDTIQIGNGSDPTNHTAVMTYTIDNGTVEGTWNSDDLETVEIPNTRLSALPSTGGIGTYLFTIIGVVIMAVAAGIFFVKRRRDAE